MKNAELFLKKQEDLMMKKNISSAEAMKLIKKIEEQIKFEIIPMIKKILSREADSFSISKDKPYSSFYVGNCSESISITLRTLKGETKLSIPKESLEI